MNTQALEERERNSEHIHVIGSGDCRTLVVDTKKVTLKGYPWRTLGDWGKRKFENILAIENREYKTRFIYA
jgi:hypothetical protein